MLERFNKSTRIIIAVTLAIIIWLSGILIGQEQAISLLTPTSDFKTIIAKASKVKVSVMIDYGDGQVAVYPEVSINYGDSVVRLLERLGQSAGKELSINYQLADLSFNNYRSSADGKQWHLWLNNILQQASFDKILLKSGDIIEFKYLKLKE